ncbi:MAG: hypothetical protein ACTHMZ_02605 [Actinomycetes bacterium]
MGSVLTMQPLSLLLNEVPPSHDRARARLLRWPEDLPDVEVWCCWDDGRREWRRGLARGWTADCVYVQLSVDGQPVLRWMWAEDVRRAGHR